MAPVWIHERTCRLHNVVYNWMRNYRYHSSKYRLRRVACGCSCINGSCWNWDGAAAAISTGGWLAFCSSFDLITDLAGGLSVMLTGWQMNRPKNVRIGDPVSAIHRGWAVGRKSGKFTVTYYIIRMIQYRPVARNMWAVCSAGRLLLVLCESTVMRVH